MRHRLDDLLETAAIGDAAEIMRRLDYGGGRPAATLNNVLEVLEGDPKIAGVVHYDEFLDRLRTDGERGGVRDWTEIDELKLLRYIEQRYRIPVGKDLLRHAVKITAQYWRRNCVTDWLNCLVWDRVGRVDLFAAKYLGAEDSEYTRAAARNFWISMVARILDPGCQADLMLVLEGKQGHRKSSALREIGREYHLEALTEITTKDFFLSLRGKFLIEIAELDAFSRAEVTRIKQVITSRIDSYRKPYGEDVVDFRRRCVFVGTTNRDDWARDGTGARRFMPVRCEKPIEIESIARDRDQLFAESVFRYRAGESYWEMPGEETLVEQQDRFVDDPWLDLIREYLAPVHSFVTTEQVMREALGYKAERMTRQDAMRVGDLMRHLGWRRPPKRDQRVNGVVRKIWIPPR